MKIISAAILLAVIAVLQHPVYTNSTGAIAGRTGAPGEQTCTSCHGGNVINAPANPDIKLMLNGLEVQQINPNTDYDVEISYASGGANNRSGFQIVALNGNNQNQGTLVAGTGTRLVTGNQRTYLTHSSARVGATATWSATWNSGNAAAGQTITLYAASRSNAQVTGISNKAFLVTTPTNLISKAEAESFKFFPSLVVDEATITGSISSRYEGSLSIYNTAGQLVQQQRLTLNAGDFSFSFRPEARLNPGSYIARFSAGNIQKNFRFKKL